MKLPNELKQIAGKHWFDPTPTFLSMFSEALVRDCAKAIAAHLDNCTHPVCVSDRKRTGFGECAGGYLARNAIDAILARYSLEPEDSHD